jgi:pSer/pThr/pTyr-binding forkhead associated (FHA) protein
MENISASLLLAMRVLMALTLYGFLTWCFVTMWRDLQQQAQNLAKQRVPPLRIALIGDKTASEELRFTAPEITIGRHPSCEWMLPNDTVSSRHARLVFHHDQWWLEDLDSRNGTFLNGEAVGAPAVLTNQDNIRCGQVSFSVNFEDGRAVEESFGQ